MAACRLSGCHVAKTGECMEGIKDLARCPNHLADGEAGAPDVGVERLASPKLDVVRLPRATAMSVEATYAVTRSSFARVVVFAGEQRSGKTTLLSSIYEAFQGGPMGSLAFAGSQTLHGFELRCHLSRYKSGLDVADTDRTKPGEGFQFLHLGLREMNDDSRTELLLGDMSGELYKAARDSSDECLKYKFIGLAHEFVVLLDGRKVANSEHAEAYAHATSLVRALVDTDILGSRSRVTMLTTKWDLLREKGKDHECARLDELEQHFKETFGPMLGEVLCARVAVRPERGDAEGLEALVRDWIARSELHVPRPRPVAEVPALRPFDRYAGIRRATSPWSGEW